MKLEGNRLVFDNGLYLRITKNEDGTFYVRDTGAIIESIDIYELLELIIHYLKLEKES